MLVRVLLAAIAAGLLGGVFATAAQAVRVTPLIIAAEAYENKAGPEAVTGDAAGHVHDHGSAQVDGHSHDGEAWAPADGWERTLYTLISNMIVGVGFALLVTAAILVTNQSIDIRSGLLWGLGGFVTFVLAPNLGLPPELPGTVSGDLDARQLWWLAAVVCTGAGLSIFAFKRHIAWMVAGVALIAAPHVLGAPQADVHESLAPASLAVQFVVASMATVFVYWLFLGGVLGFLLNKAIARERGLGA
jgi:cobalt transporter subunit CbtA